MQERFVKQALAYLPSMLLPGLTAFVTMPILTRLFLPTEYGYWVLALGVTEFLLAFASLGFGSAALRFFPAYKAESDLGVFFTTLSTLTCVVIVVASGASFFMLFLLRGYLPATLYSLLLLSILIFIVQAVFIVFITVIRIQERSGVYTAFQLVSYYGGLGIGLLLVIVFGFRIEGLLWGTLLTLLLALPFLLYLATKGVNIRTRHFRAPDALQMWRYAWPLALGNVALWALRLLDRYIIIFFRSGREVGLYSVAYNISGKSIDMLVALFLLGVSPMVLNTWESKGREATEKVVTMMTRLYLLLCLPAAVGLSVLGSHFVTLLSAEAYHEGSRIVGYIAFSSFFWGLADIAQMGMVIKKQARRLGINQIVAALVNLGLNLLLVPRFGFVAAGINVVVGYVILFILNTRASRLYLTWQLPVRTLRNVIIAVICMWLTASGINSLSHHKSGVHIGFLFLSILVAMLVYFTCLWWLGEVNEKERSSIRRLWHEVSRRTTQAARRHQQ